MQDSNPQADGNAEARSHDEWRSDRSADTVLRDGARIPTPADGAGAGERVGRGGVGEKPFEGFAPTGPAPTPKDAPPDQTNECAEPGVTPSRCKTGQKAPPRQSSPRERRPHASKTPKHTLPNTLRTGHGIPPEYLCPARRHFALDSRY